MKFYPTKAFFVPVAAIVFLLSLSSCGKDYDLVSDYVVRENVETDLLNEKLDTQKTDVAVINSQNK